MVMNVNARIDWQTGMEITAQTFTKFDENIVYRQQVASRIMNGIDLDLSRSPSSTVKPDS